MSVVKIAAAATPMASSPFNFASGPAFRHCLVVVFLAFVVIMFHAILPLVLMLLLFLFFMLVLHLLLLGLMAISHAVHAVHAARAA